MVSLVLFVALALALALYVWHNRQDMQRLLALTWQQVALLLLLALGGCMVNCLYHLVILRTYPISLSLVDWMGVVSVANAMAYVLPLRADLVFSAAYYKRVKGLAYTKSISMAAGNIVFGVAFSLVQIGVALLCTGMLEGIWPVALWTLLALGLVATLGFVWFALRFSGKNPRVMQRHRLLRDVVEGFVALLTNRPMLWRLLGCLVGSHLFQLLLYMVCFQAIGLPVTLYQALFYSSISWLSSIVAIVPGNLGIKESVMGASMLLMGSVFQNGVAVSLLQRVAVMVMYLLLGVVFAYPVYARFSRRKADG